MLSTQIERSNFSNGGIKELTSLFFPLLFITFASSLFFFLQQLLFARSFPKVHEAAINAIYVFRIFQMPSILIAMMAQVFVGKCYGAKQTETIGSIIWQFIWFSFFSLFLITPISLIYGQFYFHGTEIENLAIPYFNFLMVINFLYPLGAALSSFYIGLGKTRLVLFAKLGFECLALFLSYLLILGKWGITPLGLIGGAFSMFIGQIGFCILLLIMFLLPKQARLYHSWNWHFKPKLFWECIQPGLLRGLNAVVNFLNWTFIARLMTIKGGNYLIVLSVGGTVFLFLGCFADAICQAMTTMVSQILGMEKFQLLKKVFRSGTLLATIIIAFLGFLLLLFSKKIFPFFFPQIILDAEVIRLVFLGIWLSVSGFIFIFIPISYILSFKDIKFLLLMGLSSWISGYFLMYCVLEKFDMPAQWFWVILCVMHFSSVFLGIWRTKKLIRARELISL